MMRLPSPKDPVVAVVSRSPRLDMLMSRLREARLQPFRLSLPVDPALERLDAVLVDAGVIDTDAVAPLREALPETAFVRFDDSGVRESALQEGWLRVVGLEGLVWLRVQLAMALRARERDAEAELRRQTLAEFGQRRPVRLETPAHVLYAGEANGEFLALHGALRARGARVTAALSAAGVQAHLEAGQFSVVLLDLAGVSDGLGVMRAVREADGRLGRLPLAILPGGADAEVCAVAEAQADALLPREAGGEAMARACLSLVRGTGGPVEAGDGVHDRLTGLPSRLFFESHLRRQILDARARGVPLCLMTLRLPGEALANEGVGALARRVARFTRAEDMVCRLDWRTLVVSMRATDFQSGEQAARRLIACLKADGLAPEALQWRVVEARAHHDETGLIGHAVTGPFSRARAA